MKMVTVDRRLHGSATGPLWLQSVAPSDTSQSLPSLLLHGTEIFAILALRLLPPLRSNTGRQADREMMTEAAEKGEKRDRDKEYI